jgi:hypothetical protein
MVKVSLQLDKFLCHIVLKNICNQIAEVNYFTAHVLIVTVRNDVLYKLVIQSTYCHYIKKNRHLSFE